jgi:hypothetical protein
LDTFLLLLVAAATTAMAILSLRSRDGMLQFPFLASAVYLGWVLPPAIGLCNSNSIPDGSYSAMMLMALLCVIAIFAAQKIRLRSRLVRSLEYDQNALMLGSAGLSIFGVYFWYELSLLPPEAFVGQMSGVGTIYIFLQHTQFYGFAIAFFLLLRKFSWPRLLVVAFNSYCFLFVIIAGRRGPIMEIGLIILTALWFERRIAVRRWQILVGFVVVTLLFNSIHEYRRLFQLNNGEFPSLEQVLNIDYLETVSKFTDSGSEETRNTAFYTAAKIRTGNYNLGAFYWNDLVFHYVPGQLVGFDFKNSLMFPVEDDAYYMYFYLGLKGMNSSGFYDSFAAFWYFGALVFFAICMLMRRYYESAMAGDFRAKLLYGLLISTAMESITHSTAWFFSYVPQVLIFVLPVLAIARFRAKQVMISDLRAHATILAKSSGPPRMAFRDRR